MNKLNVGTKISSYSGENQESPEDQNTRLTRSIILCLTGLGFIRQQARRTLGIRLWQWNYRMVRYLAILALLLQIACSTITERPYRLPYANGVSVMITADHEDHVAPPEQMFDMRAAQPQQVIVAAAPGWIREIVDSKGSNSVTNNYVWIEHPLDYCQPLGSAPPSSGSLATACRTCPEGLSRCNEWTLYAHMRQNSVTATPPSGAGLSEDDWVAEGQAIAVEGDVGCQQFNPPCTRHLHFTIFVFEENSLLAQPSDNGDYEDYADLHGRPERVPLFCTLTGLRLVDTGQSYTPASCSF